MKPKEDAIREESNPAKQEFMVFVVVACVLGLGLIVSGVIWGLLAGWERGNVAVSVLGLAFLLVSSWLAIQGKRDLRAGTVEVAGAVTGRRSKYEAGEYGMSEIYFIRVSGHEFQVSQKFFDWVRRGDEVVVAYYPRSKSVAEITRTKKSRQVVSAVELREQKYWVESQCAALRKVGIDTRSLERDPFHDTPVRLLEDPSGWIEVANGPIRWAKLSYGYQFHVPDARIG